MPRSLNGERLAMARLPNTQRIDNEAETMAHTDAASSAAGSGAR
jgi:hypothetical protein